MEFMNIVLKCPKCNGNMICESWSLDPNIREGQSVDPHTYRLRCPAGHIWKLEAMEDEPRRVVATCVFCGKELYDGDYWRNYLPKEVVVEKGQDAADAYLKDQSKAMCKDCEKDHPIKTWVHDGIMWITLRDE